MRSIIVREFGEPEVMKIEEIDIPQPSPSQVLVKLYAAGVNPVDTYLRTGNHAHAPKLPYTPGKDGAGVIETVGEDVSQWRPGDRVYTANSATGTYAEYCLCDESDLGRLPDDVSFEAGACMWTPYATAYRALFQKAKAQAGETVLIHGASGGVGLAALQWAKGARIVVIGTAGSDAGKELVMCQGADAVFDHADDEHFRFVREHTGGKGVDVIVEMLANVNLERDFECLAMNGRIVIVGNRGSIEFTPRLAMTKDATIYGMSLFNSDAEARSEIHSAIFTALTEGKISPVIHREFPLADARSAHHEIIEGKALGKMVIRP